MLEFVGQLSVEVLALVVIVNRAMFRLWVESTVELRLLHYSIEWSIIKCFVLECPI